MKRPIVFLTHSPAALANYYGERALAGLAAVAEVRTAGSDVLWTAEALAAAARDCDVIISDRRAEGGAALFEQLPGLRAFVRCAVDIRNIDLAAANRLGILVTQASAGFMASVSEWIVGVMIDLSRNVSGAVATYRAGEVPTPVMGRELRGATLGIIGYGQIGRYLAPLGRAFGMRVLVSDPHVDGRRARRRVRRPARPARPGRLRRLPRRRDTRDREPDGCRRVRSDAAPRRLHQRLARQPGRRGSAARRARRRHDRRLPRSTSAARPTRCPHPSSRATRG